MNQVEWAGVAVTGAAALATVAGVIKNWETIKNWWKEIQRNRRIRFAMRQYPFCATVCMAATNMTKIMTRLDEMFSFIQVTREISLETHGIAIIDKCKIAIAAGFMSQLDKDELIHSFIVYVRGEGNGKVYSYVQLAMNLPTSADGHINEVDLNEIIIREMDKFDKRRISNA